MLRYLGDESFTYSETPPPAARTLDGFLFDAKTGYCQQYSGAMALLLRMAGIPARVVTGFSTGATDTKTGEYVVRDFDAHSWVEVYYPGWGWITFDPTPAASPARSQPADAAQHRERDRQRDPAVRRPARRARRRRPGRRQLEPVVALAAARPRRARDRGAARARPAPLAPRRAAGAVRARARAAPDPPRAGPGTTLHALEARFAATPAAAGYVRALRESRYGDAPSHPTRAQRRGLRSELGRGTGLLGHLRAWWALPPR